MQLKKILVNFRFLVLFLIFFLAAIIAENRLLTKRKTVVNIHRVESILHDKEDLMDETINLIVKVLEKSDYRKLFQSDPSSWEDLFHKDGMFVMVYQNNKLKFWSDNAPPLDEEFNEELFTNPLIKLSNGWYIPRIMKYSDYQIFGLILLKNNYSYKNQYLTNDFQKKFKLSSTILVSADSVDQSYNIFDKSKEYAFSLNPGDHTVIKSSTNYFVAILYFFALIFLLLCFQLLLDYTFKIWSGNLWLLALLGDLLLLRFLMIQFRFPSALYQLVIFEEKQFAGYFFSSPGDFLISSLFILFFCYNVFRKFDIKLKGLPKMPDRKKEIIAISLMYLLNIFFVIILFLNNSFLKNIENLLEVYRILNLNIIIVLGLLNVGILLGAFFLIADRLIKISGNLMQSNRFIVTYILSFFLAYVTSVFLNIDPGLLSIVLLFILVLIIAYVKFIRGRYNYSVLIISLVVISVYTTFYTDNINHTKEIEIKKSVVTNLANERDKTAEDLLTIIDQKINSDSLLKKMILDFYDFEYVQDLNDRLYYHLLDNYFYGFWEKYRLQVYAIDSVSELLIDPDNITVPAKAFFEDKINKLGIKLGESSFYALDEFNNIFAYIGQKDYSIGYDSTKVQLFISLDSEQIPEELGFPDLLLEGEYLSDNIDDNYSYAKYTGNRLISQSGDYPYSLSLDTYSTNKEEYVYVRLDDHNHMIYNTDDNNSVILSRPAGVALDYFISFSYIFVFYYILLALIIVIANFPIHLKAILFDFRKKIQFAMFSVLLMSFILVGGGIVYYNLKQHENNNNKNLSEKTGSVLIELKHKLEFEKELHEDWYSDQYANLNELLTKFSNVFKSDINLYNLDGSLLATSRPEIFDKGLIGRKIDSEAFTELSIKKKASFIHNERIGNLKYLSSYVPFSNYFNEELAYLDLPYFSKQSEIKKEISTFIVAIINVYVLLILLSFVIAVFISNQLTKPLEFIRNKFRKIQLGKTNEVIEYSGKDEIGDLVNEYNKMVVELSENVKLLAKSERESAWREMAKQIAHEIKNPLTPMKLSVQHLQKAWKDKVPDWEDYLARVSNTLIEQIDSLSVIASAFSTFAQMPKANNEAVDIIAKIKNAVLLFRKSSNTNISLEFNNIKTIYAWADKEQLLQVFNNLITNAIQSVPEGEMREIEIEVQEHNSTLIIMVTDNGSGIPEELHEKLFTPNFTTKTSGMGLGLAITKRIIDYSDGKIWFETEMGEGSTFIIELPVYRVQEQ